MNRKGKRWGMKAENAAKEVELNCGRLAIDWTWGRSQAKNFLSIMSLQGDTTKGEEKCQRSETLR